MTIKDLLEQHGWTLAYVEPMGKAGKRAYFTKDGVTVTASEAQAIVYKQNRQARGTYAATH